MHRDRADECRLKVRISGTGSLAQDGWHEIRGERLDRVITAHLAHNVARWEQRVAQQDLHLAADAAHIPLWHTQKEILLRPGPWRAALVGESEPRRVVRLARRRAAADPENR